MEEETVIEINPIIAEIIIKNRHPDLRQTILEQISENKCQKFYIVLKDVHISGYELRQGFGFEEIKLSVIGD